MGDRRDPTDPASPVVVNVNKTHDLSRQKNSPISIATLASIVALLVTVIGFFATYVFATKAELASHKEMTKTVEHEMQTQQVLTDVSVKQLSKEIDEVKVGQKVTNTNINKLLRKLSVKPVSRDEIMRLSAGSEDIDDE